MTRPELREPDLPRTAKVRDKALRTGWTTGACAAGAAKAAALVLRGDPPPGSVDIPLPQPFQGRDRAEFSVERADGDAAGRPAWAEAVVVKDAGDDPDATDGARLTVRLEPAAAPGVAFAAGEGVGTVTKPGLGLEIGGPAINPVPREMITAAVGEVWDHSAHGLRCTVSVPDGERMARKTTNRRLGILGGISILGTTGVVRPFSTASWRASVTQAVDVLAAQGETAVVLATGGRTERAAMRLLPSLGPHHFVEVGDFTGAALRHAVDGGLQHVRFVGMVGKLTKLAAGVLMTHYTRSKIDTDLLAEVTSRSGGTAETVAAVAGGNTARHVYELWQAAGVLRPACDLLCERAARNMAAFVDDDIAVAAAMIDFNSLDAVGASANWGEVNSW